MDKEILNQILKEIKEIKEELRLLKNKDSKKDTITKDTPKERYTGPIVTNLFSKFYKKVEEGNINSAQESFGRGCRDFYNKTNYLSTKQFDSLNRLVRDVVI